MPADESHTDPAGSSRGETPSRTPLDDALSSFTDGTRRDEARLSRQSRADQAVVDGLSGTFRGTLVDLAEARRPVTVLTRQGAHHRGVVTTVGVDVAVLGDDLEPQRWLLALDAIEGIRCAHMARGRTTSAVAGPNMADLLATAFDDAQRVAIMTRGGNRVIGVVDSVGEDQVSVRLDGDGDLMVVPIAIIDEVVVR